jgi:hypothetical protein
VVGRERKGETRSMGEFKREVKRVEEDEEGRREVGRVGREGREGEEGEARGGGAD